MLRPSINRRNKSITVNVPAPIKGLNYRDSWDSMNPLFAIQMDNYMPKGSSVVLRPGYKKHILFETPVTYQSDVKTKTIYPIKTLASYNTPTYKKLLCVVNKKLIDISSPDEPKEFETELTSDIWQTVQYKDRLFFLSGTETPKVYYIEENGTEHFEDWGFTSTSGQMARIVNGTVSHEFIWFVEKGSMNAYYTAEAGNISGELSQYDLSQIAKFGGELVAVANWTVDGGQGTDDYTAFITSEGEVMLYSGTNPNEANSWELKGNYKISKPIGYRCTMQYQGDIVIITEDGYFPMSKALAMNNATQSGIAFSDAIRDLVLSRTANYKNKDGWQGVIYGKDGCAIFNVPVANQFEQHVVNLNTGAWCRFVNIRAYCWCMFENELYFGSDSTVYQFGNSYSDDGILIEGVVKQAYSNLGNDNLKRITMINPRTKASTQFDLTIYTNMDLEDRDQAYIANIGTVGQTKWNEAKWSSSNNPIGTKWSTLQSSKVNNQWIINSSVGYKASVVFKTKTKGNAIEWYNTGIIYESGQGIM